jgi:multidrug efflux pump
MDLRPAQHRARKAGGAEDDAGAPVYLKDVALVEDGFEDMRRMSPIQRPAGAGTGHPQAARRQRRGGGAGDRAEAGRDRQDLAPEGHGGRHQLRLDALHRGVGARDRVRAPPGGHPHRLVCWLFLGSLSSRRSTSSRHPDVAPRHGGGDLLPGLHAQHLHLAGARALAVGIVVDDAIMVLENIFRHASRAKIGCAPRAKGPERSPSRRSSATLAVIAIFIPVVFMEGVVGKFFLQFGVTLCVAVPSLSGGHHAWRRPAARRCSTPRGSAGAAWGGQSTGLRGLAGLYSRVLPWALRRPVRS